MTAPRASRRVGPDPYGVRGPVGRLLPALGVAGLLVATLLTFELSTLGGGGGSDAAASSSLRPSIHVAPGVSVPGSLVYAKGGNLWIQSGAAVRQLTSGGHDETPAWSPDGSWIYFVQTRGGVGLWPPQSPTTYLLTYPVLMRIHPDGSGSQDVLSGLIVRGQYRYFYWLREPSISPDGRRAAVISDGPNPDAQDTVLQFVDLETRKLLPAPNLPEDNPLGHGSPAYSPDGKTVAYVLQQRDTSAGIPEIWLYDVAAKSGRKLTAAGFRDPAWSPDGRFLAATRHLSGQDDVVILDGRTGVQLAQITADGASWLPAWSPTGDALVFLHRSGEAIDLEMTRLTRNGTAFSAGAAVGLTEDTSLDGTSRPAWFGPTGHAADPAGSGSPQPASAPPASGS